MKRLLVGALGLLPVFSEAQELWLPVESGTTNYPIAAVCTMPGDNPTAKEAIVTAVWPDGSVIWSTNLVWGGAPYFRSHVRKKQIDSLLEWIRSARIDDDVQIREYSRSVVGASFSTIAVQCGDVRIGLLSSFELFEGNTNLVALSHGVVSLKGKSRDEVLSREPQSYLQFRATWLNLRHEIQSFAPMTGQEASNLDFRIEKASGP